jgi:cysteinyl-tRNA synthetase
MALRIYNTISRTKEPFIPLEEGKVKLYVCGPTVYDDAHVGHAMSSVVFDIIRRYLEYSGYEVLHAMNFTDVDDKIIRRANNEGRDPFELASYYVQQYKDHLDDLNVLPAHINPKVTEEIDHIISINQKLIEKGYAYPVGGDVYFRVARDEDYGRLSRRQVEDQQAGARVQIDERKEAPGDFALWKGVKPGEPCWPSPWGDGRPGWHIECSAMCIHHLGEQLDIHGGGNDLIFPHHENEIAQSESLTGKPFSTFWVHNGMVQLGGEKMSKSTGNLIRIDEFLADHDADVFRLAVLNSSYRTPLTFTPDVIEQAKKGRRRLLHAVEGAGSDSDTGDTPESLREQMDATRDGFLAAMNDDFNTAGALGKLYDLVRAINQAAGPDSLPGATASARQLLKELTAVLGLMLETPVQEVGSAAPFIQLLLDLRQDLRTEKMWALADRVRDQLTELGVVIEDSRDGATWHWK